MSGSLIAMGAPADLAQSQPFDGAYKGSLECDQRQPDIGILRTPLAITVRNGRAVASAPIFDIDGRHEIASAVATGTVDAGGTLNLAYTVYTRDAEFHGHYTGTLNATGGTLTGTQVWTRVPAGGDVTRICTGIIFDVASPRQ
jgi:hypothetical protein